MDWSEYLQYWAGGGQYERGRLGERAFLSFQGFASSTQATLLLAKPAAVLQKFIRRQNDTLWFTDVH